MKIYVDELPSSSYECPFFDTCCCAEEKKWDDNEERYITDDSSPCSLMWSYENFNKRFECDLFKVMDCKED